MEDGRNNLNASNNCRADVSFSYQVILNFYSFLIVRKKNLNWLFKVPFL